jgi:hypothetical protein
VPGGGGSGAANWISAGTGSPGAGAAGQIIVTEYYPGGATGRIVSQAWTVGPPANPQDGDVWMATGVDANGTCWQFRYNAGSASAYKWEFVGGPPAFASVETGESTASGTYVDLATVGPTFTCARGGDYQVMLSSTINNNTLNCGGVYSFDVGAVAAIDNNGLYQVGGPAGINFNFGGKFSLVTGVVAAAVLRGKYRIASGGTATFAYRRMQVTPVRVA